MNAFLSFESQLIFELFYHQFGHLLKEIGLIIGGLKTQTLQDIMKYLSKFKLLTTLNLMIETNGAEFDKKFLEDLKSSCPNLKRLYIYRRYPSEDIFFDIALISKLWPTLKYYYFGPLHSGLYIDAMYLKHSMRDMAIGRFRYFPTIQ